MKTDPLKIPLFQRTSICMATDGISWNCFRHCHHAKKKQISNENIGKRKQTDCYNPPFPSQLCPSAAPPAEPLAQWAACHALDGKLGPQCAHNIHHVGRIWDFLTCGHMKKSNCQFLIAETQKNAAYSYCRSPRRLHRTPDPAPGALGAQPQLSLGDAKDVGNSYWYSFIYWFSSMDKP